MRRKRLSACISALLLAGAAGMLSSCTGGNDHNSEAAFQIGTIYSHNTSGQQMIVYDAGHSYSLDEDGNVVISYREGETKAAVPLALDTEGTAVGMRAVDTGFYISEDKTAIVYGGYTDGQTPPLTALYSDDKGETWNSSVIENGKGYDSKFIGFTSRQEGWIVSGGSAGVGHSLNYIYQTSDGGKTWQELGNPNDVYAEKVTGAGFSGTDIIFLGFRYYEDSGPVIYWSKNKGQSWEKLAVNLPEQYADYQKTPLSPVFSGEEGLFPIIVSKEAEMEGTIFLISRDKGLTWTYDAAYDNLQTQ